MTNSPPTWAVHATVHEPTVLLLTFAAHYLALGATEVNFALDRPDPAQIAVLQGIKGVSLTLCDDAYWAKSRSGRRPHKTVPRQTYNVRRCYRRCRADWLLFCDADEFVVMDQSMTSVLAATAPDVSHRRFATAERAFNTAPRHTIFDGPFRRYLPGQDATVALLYGATSPFGTDGMLGHMKGKSISRTGGDLKLGIHWPHGKATGQTTWPTVPELVDDAHLLHFDGLTPLHVLLKCLQWYDNGLGGAADDHAAIRHTRKAARAALIKAVYAARKDKAALDRIVESLFLDAGRAAALRAMGGLIDHALDLGPVLRGLPSVDLSPAAFDLALRAQHDDLITRTGFAW